MYDLGPTSSLCIPSIRVSEICTWQRVRQPSSHYSVSLTKWYTQVGTVVLLVFGSQTDVLRVWCFWRRDDLRKKPAQIRPSHEPTWSIDLSKASSPEDKDEPLHLATTGLESGVPVYGDRHLNLGN